MASVEREAEMAIDRKVDRGAFVLVAVFMLAFAGVNATNALIEAGRHGTEIAVAQPFVEELSSIAVLIALFPLIAQAARRFTPMARGWLGAIGLHFGASIVLSAAHIVGMTLLRKALFPLVLGEPYRFFDDPLTDLVYEYRKDLLTYATLIVVLQLMRQLAEHRREIEAARADARQTGRVTLKSGGRTIWIDAKGFEWAEAAGNYVEVKAGGRTHLARIGLSALEDQLCEAGLDVARIHRSFLVNRRKIAQMEPTGDGDFRITMSDGSTLRGSRRYRSNLED